MRVLHVISSLGMGGAEAALFRLCTASPERVADTVVSLTGEGIYAERLRAAGLKVHALEMQAGGGSIFGVARLFKILRQTQPDVVQTWLYHGDLIGGVTAKLAGIRNIVWGLRNSTIDRLETRRTTRWTLAACAHLSRTVPRRIISCSRTAACVHVALGYPVGKIVIIPNGYDCQVFRPDSRMRLIIRRELNLPEDITIIGMVARYDAQKDIGNLLDALATVADAGPRYVCILVGMGMDVANRELATAINTRGLTKIVRLLGPRRDVPAIMTAMDINVLSSSYGEAFPNVVAEAMACGTPTVVTDVGDAAVIVGDTGWVVPPSDSCALAGALMAALGARRNVIEWGERQRASRQRILANYRLDQMVTGYEAVWRSLCAQDP